MRGMATPKEGAIRDHRSRLDHTEVPDPKDALPLLNPQHIGNRIGHPVRNGVPTLQNASISATVGAAPHPSGADSILLQKYHLIRCKSAA